MVMEKTGMADVYSRANDSEDSAELFSPLHPVFADAPDSVTFRKLRKRLVRQTQEAIRAFGMVSPGKAGRRPRWLVCLSGGKDSYTLLSVLLDLQWQGALPVDLLACNLDQGQPGFPKHILPEYLDARRRAAQDHHAGHLFGRDGESAGVEHVLLAVLAHAAGHSLSCRA
jgi:hypothetical protein